MYFCSFASGSSGNCYLAKDGNSALLVDAGISGKRIFEGLEATDTSFGEVSAVLVTHEHIDHVRSLSLVTRKLPNIYAYANSETWDNIDDRVTEDRRREFVTGEEFEIDNFTIRPFATFHDAADPVGFSIISGVRQVSIVTDIGHMTEEIEDEIAKADLLVIEANHEENVLLMGRYPYPLKQRILGDNGHLSNVTTGETLSRVIKKDPKPRRIFLGHLSKENNNPELALLTVRNILDDNGIKENSALKIEVARRDEMSSLIKV